jgi:hypothetical protein
MMCPCRDGHDSGHCHRPITKPGFILCDPCLIYCDVQWEYTSAPVDLTQHDTSEADDE